MITQDQADQLAKLVRTVRPAWDHVATVRTLLTIGGSMDLAALTAHAVAVANNPDSRTPKALTFATNPDEPTPDQPVPTWQGPPCDICGRSAKMCRFVEDKERAHGVPDPHGYTPALKPGHDGRRPAYIGNPDPQPTLEP